MFRVGLAACIAATISLTAAEKLCTTVAEITAAAKSAQPGDTVLLRDGTWTDADIAFEAGGTADQPITLRAATPGKVVLTGRSRVRIAGQYVVVDGLRFERCHGGAQFDMMDFRTS